MEEQHNIMEKTPKRPQMLSFLCILTFIGSGLGVAGFFMVSINYEETMNALKVLYSDMPEASFMLEAPKDFFVVSLFLSAFSVVGALLMWHLRKIGFHLYTSAQLIYLIVPFLYFGGDTNPIFNFMLTALFVYLYARNLAYMR